LLRSISRMLSRRYAIERYLHFTHRVTGIYMVTFLFMHVIIAGMRVDHALWAVLSNAFSNPVMLSFVVAAVFHGLNGLRLIAVELGYMVGKPKLPIFPYKASSISGVQKLSIVIVITLFTILSLIAVLEFVWG